MTLTRDTIAAAKGRALDALVSDHLGIKGVDFVSTFGVAPLRYEYVPEYSTGWAGAGLVLDAMKAREWIVKVESWGRQWRCRLIPPTGREIDEVVAMDHSVGVATCRAALLAILAESA